MAINNLVNIKIKAVENLSEKLDGIKMSTTGLNKELTSFKTKIQGLQSTFQNIATYGGIAFTALSLGVNNAINKAVNLGESVNAVNVVFGEWAEKVLNYGKTASTSIGLANADFNQMATITGALFQDVGLSMDKTSDLTIKLTERAADMASVFNTSVSDAMSAINQAIRGETEAIRRYAGDVTDATLQEYLFAQWVDTKVASLSEAEKRLLRVDVLMKQTAVTAGDFANTSDSLANRQRILNAQTQDMSAKFGNLMIPLKEVIYNGLSPLISWITGFIEKYPRMSQAIAGIGLALTGIVTVVGLVWLALPGIIAGFTALAPLVWIVWGAIWILLSPIWLVIAGITGLILLFRNGFSEWVATFTGIAEVIGKFAWFFARTLLNLGKVWLAFNTDLLLSIAKVFWVIINNAVVFAKNLWKAIAGVNWGQAWAGIQQWFWKAMSNIVDYARKVWAKIKNFFKNLLTGKDANILDSNILVAVGKQADTMFEEYQNVFDALDFSNTKSAISTIWNDFEKTFGGIKTQTEKAGSVITKLWDTLDTTSDKWGDLWDKIWGGAKKAKEEIEEAKEETYKFDERLKAVTQTAIKLSSALYEKLGKSLGLIETQEALNGLEEKFKKAFGDNNTLISETESIIKSLKGEIDSIGEKISSLSEQKVWIQTEATWSLAERAVEIERKIRDEELDGIQRYNLEKELSLAKEKAGYIALEDARKWADMNETERILATSAQKQQAVDLEIQQQTTLLSEKTKLLDEESAKLTELQNLKVQFEENYHSLFMKNMEERNISIQKAITAMQKLITLSWTSKSGGVSWARAVGWPVMAGSTYRVNEQGQEFYTPTKSGYITPTGQGSSPSININIWGVTVQNTADENRLVSKIKQELTRTMQLQKLGIS